MTYLRGLRKFLTAYAACRSFYDGLRRPVLVTEAVHTTQARATRYDYDAGGNVTFQTDPRGVVTAFAYDALSRRTQVTEAFFVPAGIVLNHGPAVTRSAYDAADNLVSMTDPRLVTSVYAYDGLNRQVRATAAFSYPAALPALGHNSPSTRTTYDANSNVLTVTDPRDVVTKYDYDLLNRRTQTVEAFGTPDASTTKMGYDAGNNLLSLTDPEDNVSAFAYDALGRKASETDALSEPMSFTYDIASRLTVSTDRLGRKREYDYDDLNRMRVETWRAAAGNVVDTLTSDYDPGDNLLASSDGDGAYSYSYDALGRPASENGPLGLNLTFGYDANSNRTSLNDSFGGAQTSQYDALNRLTIRQHAGQAPVRFDQTYTPVGQLASVTRYADLAGTVVVGASAHGYDALGRTRAIDHTGGGGAPVTTLDYDYDIASRLTAEDRDSVLVGYGYDDKSQLTADGAGAYSYDAAGNRDSHQTGPGNRLISDGTWTYSHDDEGNLVKKVRIADGLTWTFGYDHRNQMIWTERRTSDGGSLELRLDYRYDVFARRIEEARWTQATGTTVLRFGYDGQDVLADLDGANALQVRYVRPDGIDALGARASAAGVVAWYFTDLRGSVIALTDGSGVLRTEIAYDGFGNIVSETDPGFGDRYKFTGREWQEDLGWNYHRRRWYNPATGQWVTEDPIRISAGDYNYYRYGRNNPTNLIDPRGLSDIEVRHITKPSSVAEIITKGFKPGEAGLTFFAGEGSGPGFPPKEVAKRPSLLKVLLKDINLPEVSPEMLAAAEKHATEGIKVNPKAIVKGPMWYRLMHKYIMSNGGERLKDGFKIKDGSGLHYALTESGLQKANPKIIGGSDDVIQALTKAGKVETGAAAGAARGKWPGRVVKVLRIGGKTLIFVGLGLDAWEIYTAEDKVKTVTKVIGGWAGAGIGAWAGGKVGTVGGVYVGGLFGAGAGAGPGALVGGVCGTIAGGVGGYFGGREVTETVYEWVFERGVPIPTGRTIHTNETKTRYTITYKSLTLPRGRWKSIRVGNSRTGYKVKRIWVPGTITYKNVTLPRGYWKSITVGNSRTGYKVKRIWIPYLDPKDNLLLYDPDNPLRVINVCP